LLNPVTRKYTDKPIPRRPEGPSTREAVLSLRGGQTRARAIETIRSKKMSIMKPRILSAIGLMSLASISARAQLQQPPRLINVAGSSEVKVVPDEVDLNVSVETHNESLDSARQENDERVSKTLTFLTQNGVKAKDVKTDYVSIEPIYIRGSGSALPPMKPTYYDVRKGIGIRITDVSSFDTILAGLINSGVNAVHGIDFRTSELRKYKDQARALAIRAAKEKAQAMAAELGVNVGKPWSINVNDWSSWTGRPQGIWGAYGYRGAASQNAAQNVAQNAGEGSDERNPSFAVGEISVSATVNVSFLIE
jgi:hypothetical protein